MASLAGRLFGSDKRRSTTGKSIDLPDARLISREDLTALEADFLRRCHSSGLSEPDVHSEFVKRISAAEKTGETRAKLNLQRRALSDGHVLELINTLGKKPVLAKLDLSNNDISNKSASFMVKLLKGQMQLVKQVHVDERLQATFLGEVSLKGSAGSIANENLFELTARCDCLKYVNTRTSIRQVYVREGSPDMVEDAETLITKKSRFLMIQASITHFNRFSQY